MLHAIVRGRWGEDAPRLSPKAQDEIIKKFAQRQMADLRRMADNGPHLYAFSERLGNVLKTYLLASCGKEHPDERLRIEIEGAGELSEGAQRIHDALLRHSVLISAGSGKSRSGLPTRKLFFRRLFAPCFPFSPSRKGCIPLTIPQYEEWLIDPTSIVVAANPEPGSRSLFERE